MQSVQVFDRLRLTCFICHGELVEPLANIAKRLGLRQAQTDIFYLSW
jgi:hypothetical protein